MPMIRVAQVVRPASGGIRHHVASLLSRLDAPQFAPTLFAPPGFQLDSLAPGIPRVSIDIGAKTSPLRDLRAIVALSRELRGRFDLVHAHGLRGAFIGVPAARLAHVPALFTAHNLVPAYGRLTSAILRLLGKSAAVIAVSQAVATTLGAQGIAPSRIHVIPNGIEVNAFDARVSDSADRRRLLAALLADAAQPGASETTAWLRDPQILDMPYFIVAGIGRLSSEKGLDILISAFASLGACYRTQIDGAMPLLILAGAGPEEARLRQFARDVPNVFLAGAMADVAPLLLAADVVVIPSREEGQGIVALEAMASSRPVVATRVGGLVETIVDGETGILVPPEDPAAIARAIRELADSPRLRIEMGRSGRARVEQLYTLDQMVVRLTAVYRSLLQGALPL